MSYDIALVRKDPEQSWDDALAAAAELDGDPSAAELDDWSWSRIEQRIRALANGDPQVDLDELLDPIQRGYAADYVTLTAPYWFTGGDAAQAVGLMYAVALIVTAETGLEGFDLQLDLPVTLDHRGEAAAAFEAGTAIVGSQPKT